MSTVCTGLKTKSWKELYQAAICESDLNKLPGRPDDAEAALVTCARELFYSAVDDGEEGKVWTTRCAFFMPFVAP